ncbi:hemerythrin domain-containing protein [Streptomyces sp. NPDC087659]|uniref:hemerythrin domain-containing protein n=1 Tax=Streptomyces TaxID=1883 RepID=UPI0025B408CA|nr:hemerythrin domain-containing protein [Streptomyces sp. HUAS CB01]WJY50962.1 hemerythrin domain-containing protein [Streptomyces sp. HUAS CB01]
MPESQTGERAQAAGDFLLRVHADLRRELATIRRDLEDVVAGRPVKPAPQPGIRAQLAFHCLAVCDLLSGHHTHEDGAFGYFKEQFPQLGPAIDRLTEEHEVVARSLTELRALVASFEAGEAEPEAVLQEVIRLTADLEEHFTYEEEQLIPVLNAPD